MSLADAIARKREQSPQLEYMWRVELPDTKTFIDPIGRAALVMDPPFEEVVRDFLDPRDISHRVNAITTPYTTFEAGKHTTGSAFFYTATGRDIGSIQMKVDEYEDGKTLKYFLDWQKLMNDQNGFQNAPVVYKRPIRFVRMSTSGLELHVSTYLNYFPLEISASSFSYESNGVVQYDITFAGDGVRHDIIPEPQVRLAINRIQDEIMESAKVGKPTAASLQKAITTELLTRVQEFFF